MPDIRHHIGLDLGTKCGWAVLARDGGRLGSGTWDLRVRADESAGMRLVRLRRNMLDLLAAYPNALVSYELVRRHEGTKAAHVYGALRDTMLMIVDEHEGVEARDVAVADIKRLATGKGNASKEHMIRAAKADPRWFPDPLVDLDDNEADALWLAEHGRRWLEGVG
jgi:crossover junction endodeoxyribonuclease RuvC